MVRTLVEWAVLLFIGYSVALIITYFVVCIIEKIQKLKNRRR